MSREEDIKPFVLWSGSIATDFGGDRKTHVVRVVAQKCWVLRRHTWRFDYEHKLGQDRLGVDQWSDVDDEIKGLICDELAQLELLRQKGRGA